MPHKGKAYKAITIYIMTGYPVYRTNYCRQGYGQDKVNAHMIGGTIWYIQWAWALIGKYNVVHVIVMKMNSITLPAF